MSKEKLVEREDQTRRERPTLCRIDSKDSSAAAFESLRGKGDFIENSYESMMA